MKTIEQIIFIDDDEINNLISERIVKKIIKSDLKLSSFDYAEEGLGYIKSETPKMEDDKFILIFLDINMPFLNGWQVLEEIELMGESIHNKLLIFMLSSSIDPTDRMKVFENKLVIDFIEKPLTANIIVQIMRNYNIPILENKI
jgi:two-component system chemotaxis response regulator CheY